MPCGIQGRSLRGMPATAVQSWLQQTCCEAQCFRMGDAWLPAHVLPWDCAAWTWDREENNAKDTLALGEREKDRRNKLGWGRKKQNHLPETGSRDERGDGR